MSFPEWLQELAKQARVKPIPDVDVVSLVLDMAPEMLELAAAQHEALEDRHGYIHAVGGPCLEDSPTCQAIAKAEAFMETYS